MKLLGVNTQAWESFPDDRIVIHFNWTFASNYRPSIDSHHWSLNYFAVLGAYLYNVSVLREYAPFAYVLTNNRLPTDPQPSYAPYPKSPASNFLSDFLKRYPHRKLNFDYFAEEIVTRKEQISYLIGMGQDDVSMFREELLGNVLPPLQASLLLAKEEGLEEWILEATEKVASNEEWESTVLNRFGIFLWIHEGERMFLSTKDSKFLESYGLLENKMK